MVSTFEFLIVKDLRERSYFIWELDQKLLIVEGVCKKEGKEASAGALSGKHLAGQQECNAPGDSGRGVEMSHPRGNFAGYLYINSCQPSAEGYFWGLLTPQHFQPPSKSSELVTTVPESPPTWRCGF